MSIMINLFTFMLMFCRNVAQIISSRPLSTKCSNIVIVLNIALITAYVQIGLVTKGFIEGHGTMRGLSNLKVFHKKIRSFFSVFDGGGMIEVQSHIPLE